MHHNINESQSINSCAEWRKPYKRVHTGWFHLCKFLVDTNNLVIRSIFAWEGERQVHIPKDIRGFSVMEGFTILMWTWFHGEKLYGPWTTWGVVAGAQVPSIKWHRIMNTVCPPHLGISLFGWIYRCNI